jgi:hypothetical protein
MQPYAAAVSVCPLQAIDLKAVVLKQARQTA